MLLALAPALARGRIGKALTRLVTEADSQLKTVRLTKVLDPEKTRLHEHFVHALADLLDEVDAKLLLVQAAATDSEAALMGHMRAMAPHADGVMMANVMGRFVASTRVPSTWRWSTCPSALPIFRPCSTKRPLPATRC